MIKKTESINCLKIAGLCFFDFIDTGCNTILTSVGTASSFHCQYQCQVSNLLAICMANLSKCKTILIIAIVALSNYKPIIPNCFYLLKNSLFLNIKLIFHSKQKYFYKLQLELVRLIWYKTFGRIVIQSRFLV
jgi:hypothetical protein